MDWQKQITRRVMEGAGEHTGVQLEFLLQRLEACPEALPAIADALDDMGQFHHGHANTLRRQVAIRAGGADLVTLDPKGGAA